MKLVVYASTGSFELPDPDFRPEWTSHWDLVESCLPCTKSTHARWLKQCAPMVEEGTWGWLEIHESDLFPNLCPGTGSPRPSPTVTPYRVVAKHVQVPVEVATSDTYIPAKGLAEARKILNLAPRMVYIIKWMIL